MPLFKKALAENKVTDFIQALKERMRVEVNTQAHLIKMERDPSYERRFKSKKTDTQRERFLSDFAFMQKNDTYQPREKKQDATVIGCKQDGEDNKTLKMADDLRRRLEKAKDKKKHFDSLTLDKKSKLRGERPSFEVAKHKNFSKVLRGLDGFGQYDKTSRTYCDAGTQTDSSNVTDNEGTEPEQAVEEL